MRAADTPPLAPVYEVGASLIDFVKSGLRLLGTLVGVCEFCSRTNVAQDDPRLCEISKAMILQLYNFG